MAIARELRALVPDLQIDWLAQDPVTRVLAGEGERMHPASAELANESAHIESESAEHDLHCFQACAADGRDPRRQLHGLPRPHRGRCSTTSWIGDEAWELDYFLHENPELKRAAYCWLTDFVGWLPMSDGGEREAFLTADYNAEMVEHVARFPRLRDRAIFVGNPEDIVPDRLGPGSRHPRVDRAALRLRRLRLRLRSGPAGRSRGAARELGYAPDEQVCIVTVGGSGVGGDLLRRVIACVRGRQAARARVADGGGGWAQDRPVVAARDPGLEVRPYVHEACPRTGLYKWSDEELGRPLLDPGDDDL